MKAKLTGRMLAPTVEKQCNFSREKIATVEQREKRKGVRGGTVEGGIFLV